MRVELIAPKGIRALFAWRRKRWQGVWLYYENEITGQRKAVKVLGAYSPLDFKWMRDGDLVVTFHGSYVLGKHIGPML